MNDDQAAQARAASAQRWADLRPRVLSGVVMLAVGVAAIWMGGAFFLAIALFLVAAMLWEVARMTQPQEPRRALLIGAIGAAALFASISVEGPFLWGGLLLPALALMLTRKNYRALSALWAALVMIAGYGLIEIRGAAGIDAIFWLVLVVVVSDVAGYFVGRTMGGPKFWPALSPKKTWSGTIAGWVGAVIVGLGFMIWAGAPATVLLLSPVLAFAGQLGDIFESLIKRRTGVKDSSNLIPGHGGVMDRFDALVAVIAVMMLLDLLLPLGWPLHSAVVGG